MTLAAIWALPVTKAATTTEVSKPCPFCIVSKLSTFLTPSNWDISLARVWASASR